MNIASFLQDRQYGLVSSKSRNFKYKQLDQFLDEKITESFVNKPCSVSGTCRSTFIMDFSPDGTKVASTHGDHSVRVTDIATGQCVRNLQGHPRTPWCLAYHPSSNHILASGCLSGQVRIWDLYGYGCEVWQTENSTVIASLTFHPTDHVLVIAAGNSLYFWDWSQPEPFTKCSTAHEYERIRWVRFDRLGYDLYTGISNNNAIHRDEVARVSLSSQNPNPSPSPSPRNPARMTNVYSRIINRYQEYRRDRLAQETTSQAEEQGPSQQSDMESSDDMYPGVRDIDIVEPRSPSSTDQRVYRPTLQPSRTVTTNSIADHVTQLSNTAAQNKRRSAVRVISDCLINPSNDPFLSPGPSQSIFVNSTDSSVVPAASEPVNVIPSTSRDCERVDMERDLRRVESLSNNLSDMCQDSRDKNTSSSALNTANIIQPLGATLGTDASDATSAQQGSISSVADSSQTLSQSLRTSITSCSDINPFLARYLKNRGSKNNPRTVGQNIKAFPSIRDRLKSSISLPAESSDNNSAQSNTIVGSGIPPVTILPASDSSRPITVLSGSDPTNPHVSVVFSHSSRDVTGTESLPNSTVSSGNRPATTTSSDCFNSNDSTPFNTPMSSHEVVRTANRRLISSLENQTSPVVNDTATPRRAHSNSGSVCDVFPRPIVQVTSSASSTIPSIVSPTSPFQTYIRGITDRYRRNRNNRARPYIRPSLSTSSMSIMGPYLESRGMSVPNPISSVSDMSAPTTSSGMIDSFIERVYSSSQSNEEDSSTNQNSTPLPDANRNDQPVELAVDLNENYTAVRNANTAQNGEQSVNEVHVSSNDDNNNSLHIVHNANVGAAATAASANSDNSENPRDQVFVELRNTFVSMTDQIEREMSDLNRRINSLRDNFYTSLFSLRQDRQRYEIVGQTTDTPAVTTNSTVDNIDSVRRSQPSSSPLIDCVRRPQSSNSPLIIAHNADPDDTDQEEVENNEDTHGFIIQPPTLLETSFRSHRRGRQQGHFLQRPYLEPSTEPQDWRQLQRHYLHPHYSSSIFDETINRPSNAIQSAINRAIAGAFMGTGESAVANNIINQTHRIQCWDFTKCSIPDIENCDKNLIVRHCKLHNSASCDLAPNGSLLATFVPSHQGFPDDNILAVFSLLPENKGQCLYTKSFGPNAISVSISPSDKFIMVGLAAKKLSWVFTARQMVAQIYKLEEKEAGEKSTKLIKDIFHTCSTDIRTHVSGNMARWLPLVGQGLVYGTNRGHLQLVKPGVKTPVRKMDSSDSLSQELPEEDQSDNVRRFILRRVPWLTNPDPHRVSASTQTLGTRQTTSTQTETEAREASP